ncbi:MAG: AAA family ATPase [Oligoflexia bacterium]|nr:AAA family ATPase [Oligoflexia bacterium]
MKYVEYFGMTKDPFSNDIALKDILPLPGALSVRERIEYIVKTGGVMVVTGEVGSGKSTALRWSVGQYHRSDITCAYVIAGTGGSNDLYKQLCWSLNIKITSSNRVNLLKIFKSTVEEIVKHQKIKLLIIIDEAFLLRTDILAELHTITQFDYDSANLFGLILAGQNSLIDKLKYSISAPLASRVITRAHLTNLSNEQMTDYLNHHLKIVGMKKNLFSANAVTAIYQGSGGLLRSANSLARGALIACMIDKDSTVNEEHVRRASTELI